MPVFSRDVRLEDRSAGPHNRTLHALTKQPGPGAYMLPGAFGDQVDKTSNPGYRCAASERAHPPTHPREGFD